MQENFMAPAEKFRSVNAIVFFKRAKEFCAMKKAGTAGKKVVSEACKPSSVIGGHLSGPGVTAGL